MAASSRAKALRTVVSLLAAGAFAWVGGLVLGEYPFTGDGIQWLPILGGAGLGAGVAWIVNRCWSRSPPGWMAAVAGALATLGEVRAVQSDTPPGASWFAEAPAEAWAAVAAAAAVAVYGVLSARRAHSRATSRP